MDLNCGDMAQAYKQAPRMPLHLGMAGREQDAVGWMNDTIVL
jgi:hypothetical protein